MDDFKAEEITKEIGLFSIYKSYRKYGSKSKINICSTFFVLGLLTLYVVITNESSRLLVDIIRDWSRLGLGYSTTILGFLVAGFSIFATVSDKSLFVFMAQAKHKHGLSYLKYNFFALMYVFSVYLLFSLFCLVLILFGGEFGLFNSLFQLLHTASFYGEFFGVLQRILVRLILVLLGTYFFYTLILLQTFIFNIYHIVMTSIRWEAEKNQSNIGK